MQVVVCLSSEVIDIVCRSDNGGSICWVYNPYPMCQLYILGVIVAPCGMIDTSFSMDGAEVGWHPISAPLTLASFLPFISLGTDWVPSGMMDIHLAWMVWR